DRVLADALDQPEDRVALVRANGIAEDAAEETDILAQRRVLVGSIGLTTADRVRIRHDRSPRADPDGCQDRSTAVIGQGPRATGPLATGPSARRDAALRPPVAQPGDFRAALASRTSSARTAWGSRAGASKGSRATVPPRRRSAPSTSIPVTT